MHPSCGLSMPKSSWYLRKTPGIFRFGGWLPVHGTLPTEAGPVCYRSEALARELGLPNLFISFSGYWPERGGAVTTCSFKELEALPTMVRARENTTAPLSSPLPATPPGRSSRSRP